MSILLTILILGLIIFLHELGHFMTAKYYKMPVHEFAIGMGPKLFSRKKGETIYSIRALPLGGFVNIGGMQYQEVPESNENEKILLEEELENEEVKKLTIEEIKNEKVKGLTKEEIEIIKRDNEEGFFTKPAFARFVVLIAGVVMNFVTAWIGILLILLFTSNVPTKYIPAVVGSTQQNSMASQILKKNDKILEFDGNKIENWEDLTKKIMKINNEKIKLENEFDIKILRDGKEILEKVKLTYNDEAKMKLLGVQVAEYKVNFFQKVKISFDMFFGYFKMMIDGLKMLVTGKVAMTEMTGPVGLPKIVGSAYKSAGVMALLNIFVLLSINIGIMNLLPIPALDGGRLLFVIPEFIGIKVNKKIEERLHLFGMFLLILLMIFTLFNDVIKYFK